MTNNSRILKSISISFDDEKLPRGAEVILLGSSSPRSHRTTLSNVEEQPSESSPESRNDHEHVVLSPIDPPPPSIFRLDAKSSLPDQSSPPSAPPVAANPESIKEENLLLNDKICEESTIGKKAAFASSVSYDEGRAKTARQLNPLYAQLSQISTASIALADEVLNKEFQSSLSLGSTALDKKISLLSRADEMLLEARNACSSNNKLNPDSNGGDSQLNLDSNGDDSEIQAQSKLSAYQRVSRTRSLDRMLSAKEALDFAALTLRGKERLSAEENSEPPQSHHGPIHLSRTAYLTKPPPIDHGSAIDGGGSHQEQTNTSGSHDVNNLDQQAVIRSMSPTDIKLNSLEDFDDSIKSPSSFLPDVDKVPVNAVYKDLKRLDGIKDTDSSDSSSVVDVPQTSGERESTHGRSHSRTPSALSFMHFLWGGDDDTDNQGAVPVGAAMLACGPGTGKQIRKELAESGVFPAPRKGGKFAAMATALMRRKQARPSSYAEAVKALNVDPRLQDWVDGQFAPKEELPNDGSFLFGKSRTVVVHEIVRGNWTWCTAWSPDGTKLAVATENHHLAIIDTKTSVWRVRHDERITGPVRKDTTHSIRAIAWGPQFIAIGGTGNAVSILAPAHPYPILHRITGTGFVGSLDWKLNSTVLAIGSRLDKAMIVRIKPADNGASGTGRHLQHDVIHTIKRPHWVNAVAFSPGGIFFAMGDAGGQLSIYRYNDHPNMQAQVNIIASFTMEDSILSLSFSPCGKWLYSGGEDFRVTCIDTNHWEIVHRLRRNRWVQCVASSRGGTHVAVGGVSSEISILENSLGWDTVINVELKGLVPLSASWHPKDQYLALTGQSNSILVVETTNARHVDGHFLRSISSVLAVEFSPDGSMAVIGNELGVVTFYTLQGSTFVTAYEMVVTMRDVLYIKWSPNAKFVVIGYHDSILIVGRSVPSELGGNRPANSSGFTIRRVLRGLGELHSISIDFRSRYIAVGGSQTRIFDTRLENKCVRSFEAPTIRATAWSPDGRWLATIGEGKTLTIYDTDFEECDRWRVVFALQGTHKGLALAWGPIIVGGLLYLAYGGEDKTVTVVEIRTHEGTWETVLRAQRDSAIYDLDWNRDGLLAAAIGNGTVSIIDLSYLQSGLAVNEMDYTSQRQALTCFTEIRRNRGKNSMRTVKWIPASMPGSYNLLAIGGTDGEMEIIDLADRDKCLGYKQHHNDGSDR